MLLCLFLLRPLERLAVAEYCDEYICVCVWCVFVHLSDCADISGTTCKFFVHVAYGHGLVLLQRRCKIPRGRAILGVFFPIDSALYSITFGTHPKTAGPIKMPFGMMSGFGLRNSVLYRGDDP